MEIFKKKFTWRNLRGLLLRGKTGKVCFLRKSLYGLKQTPRARFSKFSQAVETFGMQKNKSDHYVFYKNSSSGIILLVVYVDDIVIIGSDSKVYYLSNPFFTISFTQRI